MVAENNTRVTKRIQSLVSEIQKSLNENKSVRSISKIVKVSKRC